MGGGLPEGFQFKSFLSHLKLTLLNFVLLCLETLVASLFSLIAFHLKFLYTLNVNIYSFKGGNDNESD